MRIVAGCLMITAGVFGPLYSVPVKGEIILFDASREVGIVFLTLAVIALITGITTRAWLAWISGMLCLALATVCFVRFYVTIGNIQNRFDNAFMGGLGRFLLEKVELSWGFWSLIAGSLMILLGATAMLRARSLATSYSNYQTIS